MHRPITICTWLRRVGALYLHKSVCLLPTGRRCVRLCSRSCFASKRSGHSRYVAGSTGTSPRFAWMAFPRFSRNAMCPCVHA